MTLGEFADLALRIAGDRRGYVEASDRAAMLVEAGRGVRGRRGSRAVRRIV